MEIKWYPYTMNGVGLQAVQEEVDLGIVIQADFKWAKQYAKVVQEKQTEH
jgi:hypothetical protein